jgi:hypothetical protein
LIHIDSARSLGFAGIAGRTLSSAWLANGFLGTNRRELPLQPGDSVLEVGSFDHAQLLYNKKFKLSLDPVLATDQSHLRTSQAKQSLNGSLEVRGLRLTRVNL